MTLLEVSEDTKNELDAMWELYQIMEHQFIEFTNIVSFKTNPWYINSMQLLLILQNSCSQTEQLMRTFVRIFTVKEPIEYANYPQLAQILDKQGLLSIQKVIVETRPDKTIRPFVNSQSIPEWWAANNKTKHNILYGRYLATIGETIHALAALYILNRIAYRLRRVSDEVEFFMNGSNWLELPSSYDEPYYRNKEKYEHPRSSQIFHYPLDLKSVIGMI